MIGFYDYTVILTYISLASGINGIMAAMDGHLRIAIACLAFSGFCDMFDGKIARTKKNRTEDEKKFGIQIDSLCDVICFGLLPVVIAYQMGVKSIPGKTLLCLYGLAGLIRLGYFNVMEEKRQKETEENRKYYQGLPITSMSVAFPILVAVKPFLYNYFLLALQGLMLIVGLMFITDFHFRKPSNRELAVLVTVVAIAVARILFLWKCRMNL